MTTKEFTRCDRMEEFLLRRIWFMGADTGHRVTGCTIKVEPTGYLLVIKAITAEGPQVAFYGGQSLPKLCGDIERPEGWKSLKWRDDKFALDRKRT